MKRTKHNPTIPDVVNKSKPSKFSQVPHSLIRSSDITGKAFKILCILTSNKKGWKNYKETIEKMMKEGQAAIETGIKELQELDFLRKIRYRDANNKRMAGSFWIISYTAGEFADLDDQKDLLRCQGYEIFPNDDYTMESHPPENHGDGNPPDGKPSPWKSPTKDTNNKNTNRKDIKEGSSHSANGEETSRKKKPSIKERTERCMPFAKHLAATVKQERNINTPTRRLKSWADEIRKLNEVEKVSFKRIKRALSWYRKNIGGEYIPVIQSGGALRSKFVNLERAMERNGYTGGRNGQPATAYRDSDKKYKTEGKI